MSCFIGRKWGPVLVGKGTKSVCVCACIPHTVRIYVRGWVCACEEEMVGEKKGSGVGLGTGTKSIIIAVRITPALHTEQSSLSLSLSPSIALYLTSPTPPQNRLSRRLRQGDKLQYILYTPHSFFWTAPCPAVACMLNRAERRGRWELGKKN